VERMPHKFIIFTSNRNLSTIFVLVKLKSDFKKTRT
jgi:hypothetical protein